MYNYLKLRKNVLRFSKIFFIVPFLFLQESNAEILNTIDIIPIKITSRDFQEKFTAVGQCKSENSKTYHSQINGTIDHISIIQGKHVNKGETLIIIDSLIAEATKSKAEATFKSAKSTYERDLSLLSKKFISQEVLDKSKLALEIAKSDLATAYNSYNNMIIKAPFDGYVGVVHARAGDDVKVGDYLFSLIAKGDKTIFIELPETLFGKVSINSEVFATDINGDNIVGKIIAISDYLNDNGTITAKIGFPSTSKIMHGSYVETNIIFNKHRSLALPEKTILKNNKGNFVYAISKDNIVNQVYIQTGVRTDKMIEIISDQLNEGDLVVSEGLTKVYEGAQISIIEQK